MNEKELRKISRRELLELLLEQANRIVDLESQLSKANKRLEDKKVMLDDAGNLAEASLKITDLFNKTMETCEIYKNNIDELNKRVEKEVRDKYEKLEKKKLKETENICEKKIKAAEDNLKKSKEVLAEAKKEVKKKESFKKETVLEKKNKSTVTRKSKKTKRKKKN